MKMRIVFFENGHERKLELMTLLLNLLSQLEEPAEISPHVLNLLFEELLQSKTLPASIFQQFSDLLQSMLKQKINPDSLIPYYLGKSFSFIISLFKANNPSGCFSFLSLFHLKSMPVPFTRTAGLAIIQSIAIHQDRLLISMLSDR
jgi:hypothetical protein